MPRLDELLDPASFDAAAAGIAAQPDEGADAFLARRQKLADAGALGPARLPQGAKDRANMADDAARVQNDIARQAERAQAEQQRQTERAAVEQQREAARVAAEQARQQKAAQAAAVKQMREQGIETRTADNGATVPDQHPDGRIKYKPDMIGDPYLDEQSGRYVRDFRDPFGAVKPVDLEANGDLHTDAQTGARYFKGAGGLRVDLGPDDHWHQREATKEQLARLKNDTAAAELEQRDHALTLAPIRAEWTAQQKDTRELRKKLEEAERTAKALPGNANALKIRDTLQTEWDGVKGDYEASKKAFEEASARETELRRSVLDGKKKALDVAAHLDKLKARSWGRKTDAPTLEDRAQSALEAANKELADAQDEARTFATTAGVASSALSGGATPGQAQKLTADAAEAGNAVARKVKEAATKAQYMSGLVSKLNETGAKAETLTRESNARLDAITTEQQKVNSALILGDMDREAGAKRLAELNAAAEAARKPLTDVYGQRKAVMGEIATAFDDPAKWEQSPERGLAMSAVDEQIAKAAEVKGSATEATLDTLQKASGVASLVEGKPITEQIATLKAELERRNAKTPRAEYTKQLAMLDTALAAKATTAQREEAVKQTIADIVAQRDGASVKGYANWGGGVIDASKQIWNEQARSAGNVIADPNIGVAGKVLHYVGAGLGGGLGAAGNLLMGRTMGDITRQKEAQEARELIGNLDATGAEQVLRSLPELEKQWEKGGTILTPAQQAAAKAEGDAGLFSPGAEGSFRFAGGGKSNGAGIALNRTLYGAEKLIAELNAQTTGALGDAALAAANDALLFVSSGKIEVDESNPQEVAQRAFLRVKLAEAIQKNAPGLTLAGSALGSLAMFMTASGIARGTAAKLGAGAAAGTIGTGALVGADQSLKADGGNIGAFNRVVDTAFKGMTTMLSEHIGDKLGDKLTGAFKASGQMRQSIAKAGGRFFGSIAGEATSDLAQNAMEGKNALEGWREILAVNVGLGTGMMIVGAIADAKARRIGGKPMAPAYMGAREAHDEALGELTTARNAGDAAAAAIAQDKVAQSSADLDLTTKQLTRVSDGTRTKLGNVLGVSGKALGTMLEENPTLVTAGTAVGRELRDVYLAGARGQAAMQAARLEKDFNGETGAPLAELVIDQHVGAAVANDLAGVARGDVNLTAPKLEALTRLGLVETAENGVVMVTDDAIPLLPPAFQTAIKDNPNKFRVAVTAGNDAALARGLVAQGETIIGGTVSHVAQIQTEAVQAAVDAVSQSGNQGVTESGSQAPAATRFDTRVSVTNADGSKSTLLYSIEAANEQEAEQKARARAEKQKRNVTGVEVQAVKEFGSQEVRNSGVQGTEGAKDVSVNGDKSPETNEDPSPAQSSQDVGRVEKLPVEEATPSPATSQPAKSIVTQTIGRVMASEQMAKTLGGLRVAVDGGAEMDASAWVYADFTEENGDVRFFLKLSPKNAEAIYKGQPADYATALLEASLREELVHFAQFEALRRDWMKSGKKGTFRSLVEAHYDGLWNALTDEQRQAVTDVYGREGAPWQMGAEMVRQAVQLTREGKTTETVMEWLKRHFGRAFEILQELAKRPAAQSAQLEKTIAEVSDILDVLEKQATAAAKKAVPYQEFAGKSASVKIDGETVQVADVQRAMIQNDRAMRVLNGLLDCLQKG